MQIARLFSTKSRGGRKEMQNPKRLEGDFDVKDASSYDFLWTIKSFSKLIMGNESRHTCGRFDVKGYSWKLAFYPNGNIVNNQISLYVLLAKAPSYSVESVFKISYELFLFDQNSGSTLSRKGENLVRVHDEMGFRNLIDLKAFKKPSNGYVVKDSCLFGVKILQVVPIQTITECLHPVDKISHEYTWKIENFSELDKKANHQKKFTAGDFIWSMLFYPEGYEKSDVKDKGKQLSLYLDYYGSIIDTPAMKVSVEYTLSIIDQIGGNHKKRTGTDVFKRCRPGCGWKSFISLGDFYDPTLGFIVNDTCIFEAKIVVIALVL